MATGYREAPESRAFPGWRAEEIHLALTESPLSETAWRALERVARAMGAREGTRPEDDPLMGSHSAKVRTEGRAQGRREGRMGMVAAALRARGIESALDATADRALLDGLSDDALMAAALECADAADFRRRVRERHAARGRHGPDAPRGDGTHGDAP